MIDWLAYVAAGYLLTGGAIGFWHLAVCRSCGDRLADRVDMLNYVVLSALLGLPLLLVIFISWVLEPCETDNE